MNHRIPFVLVLSLAFCSVLGRGPQVAAAVQAGFAERDITPDIGMEQPGGYHKSRHQSLHDPCKVRAAVFVEGDRQVAIVGVDALAVCRPLVDACRKGIQAKCGIPADAVMLAASHSHSSGPTCMIQPGDYDHASPLVQYLARVEQAIIDAVCSAREARADVQCGFGSGIEDQVAFNRRFRMRNGLSHTHPGQGNPDIVDHAGPTDPQVGVVGAWQKDGKLVGVIVNFACHATTSPGGISANYIYYLEQVIRGAMGQHVVVVFTAASAGDVTQVDNLSPYTHPAPERWAQLVGGRVGAEAVKVLLTVDRTDSFAVNSKAATLQIPRRVPRPERVKEALDLIQNPPPGTDQTRLTFAKETVLLDARLQKEPVASVEVQAIQLGPAVFVSNPAEYFCQLGLDIKKGSRFPLTFPVSLANGCIGYVPTEEALGPHGGGYETRLTSYSNLIPTAGTTIALESIKLTEQLTPGTIPTRPPHPPFQGTGWSYGNVPPEVE
jgi:neutral ceramidase